MSTLTGRPTTDAARRRTDCLVQPPQLWDDEASPEDQAEARAYCLECPLFAECLASAMASEHRSLVRSSMKAGLTPADRRWLQRASQSGGDYDAEEARLLALESVLSGQPLAQIAAREGVGGLTLRLAEKLLPPAEEVEEPATPKAEAAPGSKFAPVLTRMDEVLEWRSNNASLEEVARRLGVSRRTASSAIKEYLGQDPDEPLKPVSRASKAERAEQIINFRREGFTWRGIDTELSHAAGTTYRFVARYRSELEERGEEVPEEFQRDQAKLSKEQVVRIRERAAQGVTDLAQAMELGVNRKVITDVAAGETYRKYGGPIRPKRVNRPSAAQRVAFAGGTPVVALAS